MSARSTHVTQRRRTNAALLAAILGLALCSETTAATDRAARQARRHNARAERHFNLGQFREAAEAYAEAYKAKPLPAFLYNLGQCHKRLGGLEGLERAVFYFESYLHNAPRAPNRADVEAELVELRPQIAALKRPRLPAPPPPPPPALALVPRPQPPPPAPLAPPRRPIYKRWWFWTAVGAVAAGAATAVIVSTRPESTSPVSGTMPPGQIQLQ